MTERPPLCMCAQNPFTKLARDSDVEALSDGVDQPSSEGECAGDRRT